MSQKQTIGGGLKITTYDYINPFLEVLVSSFFYQRKAD